jgi:hypothetical protein
MESKYIAPCGMTCCDCLFYNSNIYQAARKFKEVIVEHQFDKFLSHFSKSNLSFFHDFKKMEEFMAMLDKIISMQCENVCSENGGCSIPRVDEVMGGIVKESHKCNVLICIESKGYQGCWECNELESCDKKKFFTYTYGNSPVETCKVVRDFGKKAVNPRGNKYYKWQQKASKE